MDETAVWADMVYLNTVDVTGTKAIPLKTTGNEKVRVSVCLTIQFNSIIGKFAFRRCLLAWDSFKCHITNEVSKTLKIAKVDSVVVPGGLYKVHLTDHYDEWLSNGVHEATTKMQSCRMGFGILGCPI